MRAIVGLGATDRLALASVNDKLKSTDAVNNTSLIESVPVFLDNGSDLISGIRVNIGANAEVLIEFSLVNAWIPYANIGARGKEASRGGAG